MNAALASLASRRIILFGGKGGVGKTTISALAALHFAKEKPAIIFTTDPASNLRDIFPGDDRPNGKDGLFFCRFCNVAYTSDGLTNSYCYNPGQDPNPPAKRERCGKLALKSKYADEAAGAAAGFDKQELIEKARRMRESMAVECGA